MAFASGPTIPLEFELMLSNAERQDPEEVRQTHHLSSHSSFPGFASVRAGGTRHLHSMGVASSPNGTSDPIQFTHEPQTYLPDGALDQPTNPTPTPTPTNQPINQSTNQPTNQSTNQSTNQPINQPTSQASNQSNLRVIEQASKQFINHAINR